MPGGYGTDESTPWGSSGDTGADWSGSYSNVGGGNSGSYGGGEDFGPGGGNEAEVTYHANVIPEDTSLHGVNDFFPTDENVGLGGNFAVLENLGSSNLEKNMSMYDPSGLVYNFLNMLGNATIKPGKAAGKYSPFVTTTNGEVVHQKA